MKNGMNWKGLHEKVVALNRDIQTYGENVMFRLKRIRGMLESMNMGAANTEPEIIEAMRMLMTVLESDYSPEKVKVKPEALQKITNMISIKELQTNINNGPNVSPDREEEKNMPPELLY